MERVTGLQMRLVVISDGKGDRIVDEVEGDKRWKGSQDH